MSEHVVNIKGKNQISISGVTSVVGFDSESLVVDTNEGRLTVEGIGLSVGDLSVANGEITAQGEIVSLMYSKTNNESDKSFFARIFK